MSKNHVQIVKDFFAAMRSGDIQALLALSAEDVEWIIPGEGLAAGRHAPRTRGIDGFASEGFRNAGNFIPNAL
jgi:ketosteroid isomerase-like protein